MLLALVVAASFLPVCGAVMESQPEGEARPGVAAQKEAMKKLEWMSGDWEGSAVYEGGPGSDFRGQFRQSETVREKLSGRVLLVEGTGWLQAGTEKHVKFEGLAMISYDTGAKEYEMRAYGPEGAVDPKVEVGEKSVIWVFTTRAAKMRHTVRLDDQGRWTEIRERSSDGGMTWTKFVEMTLEKKK